MPQTCEQSLLADKYIGAARDSDFAMHYRDHVNAFCTCREAMGGDDLLADARQEAFKKLPESEQERMRKAGNFGEYGLYHLATRIEVSLALRLAAHELCPQMDALEERHRDLLADEKTKADITARYPAMHKARIEKILSL